MKQAATQRVFGFEIMPAPFVVAHLQVGLTMQALDAPLSDDAERTRGRLPHKRAHRLGTEDAEAAPPSPNSRRSATAPTALSGTTPILVIIGNPPYNGFAGMAVDEERELSQAYRATKAARPARRGRA